MEETRLRSLAKSVVWRLLGVIVLSLITYVFTRDWITATFITLVHHLSFVVIYYLHERAWLRAKNKWLLKWKRWIRPFTYEIVLGHLVLGAISWFFTRSWLSVTLITMVYIENKLWIYIVYDWLWGKIKWGGKNGIS